MKRKKPHSVSRSQIYRFHAARRWKERIQDPAGFSSLRRAVRRVMFHKQTDHQLKILDIQRCTVSRKRMIVRYLNHLYCLIYSATTGEIVTVYPRHCRELSEFHVS